LENNSKLKLNSIFDELKMAGLIDKNRQLIFENDEFDSTFKSSGRCGNQIIANEAYPFPKDDLVLKYVLLHEEGHFKPFSVSLYLRYNVPAIIFFVIIFTLITLEPTLFIYILMILFLFMFTYFFRTLRKIDEICADLYSLKALWKKYHIEPSEILEKRNNHIILIRQIRVEIKKRPILICQNIFLKIRNYYANVHPSSSEILQIFNKEIKTK
jgi:hypothetical protein